MTLSSEDMGGIMKRKIFAISAFCFLLFAFGLSAQDTWIKTYRPFQQPYMTDHYTIKDIRIANDGGYHISGSYRLFDEFHYEEWSYLMKTDSDGNFLWAVKDSVDFMYSNGEYIDFVQTPDGDILSIGADLFGFGYAIKRDSDGNRYWSMPITDFRVLAMETTSDGNIILAGNSNYNTSIRKIQPDGTIVWTKSVNMGTSNAYSVMEYSAGGYVLTGTDSDAYDIFVVRTNAEGDTLWTKTFAGYNGLERGSCAIECNDSMIMVAGYFETNENQGYDGMLAKLHPTGEIQFCNTYEGRRFYSCVEGPNNTYTAYSGYNAINTNSNGDTLWTTGMFYWDYVGDRSIICTPEGYLYLRRDRDTHDIELVKTDSLGQVTAVGNQIINPLDVCLGNFPNPFNPTTTIAFNLSSKSDVIVEVYNIKGQRVKQLIREKLQAGKHSLEWNGKDTDNKSVSTGVYFYKISTNKDSKIRKMLLLK